MNPSASSITDSLDLSQIQNLARFRKRLGTEMSEILPNLYLGSLRDATDDEQLRKYKIKAIVGVHDMMNNHPRHEQLLVYRIKLSDCASENIATHFFDAIKFIHQCRIRNEAVMVHCLAGVSRSATIVTAYVMAVCDISYNHAISYISSKRPVVNPNFGFRMQLCKYRDKVIDILEGDYHIYDDFSMFMRIVQNYTHYLEKIGTRNVRAI
ncbi:hypothetical protein WR25_01586 [Diploscapter pachys]|uniref:Protein-tyrosine-phosphatase n=1 Tax=Diploscapter pachys TaxID=2018661 RepID=A0A2A2KPR2_9BILA|nr:hypothetical protein WR25_01586 [Diploscapter pachys]